MGHRPIGPRRLRRIAEITGEAIVHGSGNGGNELWFTTADHRHGVMDVHTREWVWLTTCPGFTSCRDLFPEVMR